MRSPATALPASGDNRKLLVFPVEEIPTMARGRGVTLQKYKDGGLSDIQIFNATDGFSYQKTSGVKTETDLLAWLGHRAQGRQAGAVRFSEE